MGMVALGVVMGLAFALPPGIVVAETVRRALGYGFPAALAVQLGSLIGDATWAIIALAGLAVLVQNPLAQRVLGVAGTIYILVQAIRGLRHALSGPTAPDAAPTAVSGQHGAFATGAILSLTNPWAIGYWIGPGGALAATGAGDSFNSALMFLAGFFGVCTAYAFGMSALASLTLRAVSPRVGRWFSAACSLAMLALGLGIGWRVWGLLAGG